MNQVANLSSPTYLQQATTWLQNNPTKATDAQLVAVADRDASKQVDAVELSLAIQQGNVRLTSSSSFKLLPGDEPAQPTRKSSGPPIEALMAMGAVFGGLSLAEKSPALGIGVMIGGLIMTATVGLIRH